MNNKHGNNWIVFLTVGIFVAIRWIFLHPVKAFQMLVVVLLMLGMHSCYKAVQQRHYAAITKDVKMTIDSLYVIKQSDGGYTDAAQVVEVKIVNNSDRSFSSFEIACGSYSMRDDYGIGPHTTETHAYNVGLPEEPMTWNGTVYDPNHEGKCNYSSLDEGKPTVFVKTLPDLSAAYQRIR